MIEYLRGIVVSKEPGRVILDVNGVGYGLETTAAADVAAGALGAEAELHTYLYVQEAVMRLYGFATRQEREVFEIFLNTSGIGPRTAVAILSNIEMATFAKAVIQGDLKTLTRIPGIGKKTAERISVELKDKLQHMIFDEPAGANGAEGSRGVGTGSGGNRQEAIEALIALGCKPLVAERAIATAADMLAGEPTTAELVREGLKHRR
jgi:Holliday junction DNA helicase RuvA